jgi:hypothetical protein
VGLSGPPRKALEAHRSSPNEKAPAVPARCFFIEPYPKEISGTLLTLPSLMSRAGQQLAVLVASHLLSTFFDDTTQKITPIPLNFLPGDSRWSFIVVWHLPLIQDGCP